jgi:hypothetical protein
MSNLIASGRVIHIGDAQTFGNFTKREFVLEMGDEYPQEVVFQVAQARIGLADRLIVGDEATVSFGLRGRKAKDGRWFNSLEVFKVDVTKKAQHPDDIDTIFGGAQ